MPLSTVLADILERTLAAPPPYARSVATDADGTLWAADVGDELFLLVAARNAFRGNGLARLREHARVLLDDEAAAGDPGTIARTLFARYSAGLIDVRVMCDLEAETVGDRPVAEWDALLDEVATAAVPRVRGEVRELLHAAQAAGASIHVVSGSLAALVEVTLRKSDIPFDRVTGAALHRDAESVKATVEVTSPLFEGKVTALRGSGVWPAALGLGDGGWDHTFLREVYLPVLVHPKPALVEAMRDVPRVITVR